MTNKADREAYFREVELTIRDYYLADPSNPYRQSGKTGGAKQLGDHALLHCRGCQRRRRLPGPGLRQRPPGRIARGLVRRSRLHDHAPRRRLRP